MVKGGPYGRSVPPQGQLENPHKMQNKIQSSRYTVERHWKTVEAIGLEQKENNKITDSSSFSDRRPTYCSDTVLKGTLQTGLGFSCGVDRGLSLKVNT